MSFQVKSESELVFLKLFDHMSFATHRCWEINLKVAYAKTLSAWQEHFKGSLKALHKNSSVRVPKHWLFTGGPANWKS